MQNGFISHTVQWNGREIKFDINTNAIYSLNKLIYAYNCTRYSVTSFGPYYLLFGRNPRLPIDRRHTQYVRWE